MNALNKQEAQRQQREGRQRNRVLAQDRKKKKNDNDARLAKERMQRRREEKENQVAEYEEIIRGIVEVDAHGNFFVKNEKRGWNESLSGWDVKSGDTVTVKHLANGKRELVGINLKRRRIDIQKERVLKHTRRRGEQQEKNGSGKRKSNGYSALSIQAIKGGNEDIKNDEIREILNSFGISKKFPRIVEEEAAAVAIPPSNDPADWVEMGFSDRTDLETVIIDPKGSKDHDDAFSIEKLESGGWILYAHIACVPHYVPRGSELDKEALRRGASAYFGGDVAPMLPEVLSSGVCSLSPGNNRYAITVSIEYDAEGHRVDGDLSLSVIKVDKGYVYEDVSVMHYEGVSPRIMKEGRELATLLSKNRQERGKLDFQTTEARIDICEQTGKPINIETYPRDFSNEMIEMFMVESNEVVSEWGQERGIEIIYRNHEPIGGHGKRLLADLSGRWESEYEFDPETAGAKEVQAALNALDPKAHAVAVRTMPRANYGDKNIGHFGLGSKGGYSHFTSPIRRYPDLATMQNIYVDLRGQALEQNKGYMAMAAERSTQNEQNIDEATRKINKAYEFMYMEDPERKYSTFTGYIRDINKSDMEVVLNHAPIKGKVSYSSLAKGEEPMIDEKRTRVDFMDGRGFKLGDEVTVMLDQIFKDQKRESGFIEFALID